jgi:rubredoxin
MITVRCPECGAFVDDVYEDELPMEMECNSCSLVFVEEVEDEDYDDGGESA